jgi:signal transduction histidine kinase
VVARRGSRYKPRVTAPTWFDTVGKIFQHIPDLAAPAEVQSSLREILGDPTVELFWWDWERQCYVDVHDEAVAGHVPGQVVTLVEYETRKVGVIAHHPRLLEQPHFLESFLPTMRIAMERDRLHRDLIKKLGELRASRARLVKIADDERRRLERNLHDGAQQRLTAVLLALRRLEQRLADDDELSPIVTSARTELQEAIVDLRELARGLHPPRLAQYGLAAAVRAASLRSTIPIELKLEFEDDDVPDDIAVGAYYVCAEAVTNTVKHAEASKVWITIVQDDAALTVDVRDDGIGGASTRDDLESTGLRGLIDRVEALDGSVTVVSPAGEGTQIMARFPFDGGAVTR